MNTEDDEFKRIEREAKLREHAKDDDDTQIYKRSWVGLTDAEYQDILKQTDGCGLLAFFNLVETKLRQKNI